MNARFIILIVIAVVIAGVTAMGVRSKLGSGETAGTRILVATGTIPAGTFVRAGKDFTWAEWPAKNINPSYMVEGSGRTAEEFNGAVARRAIVAGEPITGAVLVKSNEGGFLSAVLSPGTRAVSIAVNATSGNAGFIFPGDRVDLLVTHNIPAKGMDGNAEKALATETFVENVRVLAIDQMLDNPENKAILAKTVTLEVTPKQAEMINVAGAIGKISLTLRSLANDADTTAKAGEEGTSKPTITEGPRFTRDSDVSKLLNPRGNVNSRVNVFRGDETEELEFNQGAP